METKTSGSRRNTRVKGDRVSNASPGNSTTGPRTRATSRAMTRAQSENLDNGSEVAQRARLDANSSDANRAQSETSDRASAVEVEDQLMPETEVLQFGGHRIVPFMHGERIRPLHTDGNDSDTTTRTNNVRRGEESDNFHAGTSEPFIGNDIDTVMLNIHAMLSIRSDQHQEATQQLAEAQENMRRATERLQEAQQHTRNTMKEHGMEFETTGPDSEQRNRNAHFAPILKKRHGPTSEERLRGAGLGITSPHTTHPEDDTGIEEEEWQKDYGWINSDKFGRHNLGPWKGKGRADRSGKDEERRGDRDHSSGAGGPPGGDPGRGPGGDPPEDPSGDEGDDESEEKENPTPYRGSRPPSNYYSPSNARAITGDSISQRIHNRSTPPTVGFGGTTGRIEDWISQLIKFKLSRNAEELAPLKGIKFDQPPTYEGANDVETFIQWIQPFVRWLLLNRLVGPDLEATRVTVLGQYLKGSALEWFNTIVDDSTRPKKWTFENAILGLFSRFVHQSTTLQATQRFESVRYVKGEGVAGLANELLKWADRMVVYPDEYTIRRAFYNALPTRITLIMGPTRGMSPERNSLNELVDAALGIEDALVGETMRHTPRTGPSPGEPGPSNRNDRRENRVNRRPPRRREFRRKEGQDKHEGNAHPPARVDRPTQGFSGHKHDHWTATKNDHGGKGKVSDIICWRCGQRGHTYNSEKCPEKGKGPAIRRMEEGDEDDTPHEEPDTNEPLPNGETETIPEMRTMVVHSMLSDDEMPYSRRPDSRFTKQPDFTGTRFAKRPECVRGV